VRLVEVLTMTRPRKAKPEYLPRPSDFAGSPYTFHDDVPNRFELNLSDAGFARAVEQASITNLPSLTNHEVSTLHAYKDKLDAVKKVLIKRIMLMAEDNMDGIQLEAFMHTFRFGINKCVTARSMKVSRQSIQIRNKRAIRKVKKLLFTDPKSLALVAEMQRLRKAIADYDA